jgi:CRISPR-associated protein Cas1
MNVVLITFAHHYSVKRKFLVTTKDGKQMLSPQKIKSISISKGAKISSDAALLAIENEIEVLFVDKNR